MIYRVTVGDREVAVDLSGGRVLVDGDEVVADLETVGPGPVHSLTLDGRAIRIDANRTGDGRWLLALDGEQIEVDAIDERTALVRELAGAAGGRSGPKPVVAPMPGLVVRVEVAPGDLVHEGQSVAIVEAMKMENELVAEADAVVVAVLVEAGQTVEKDQLLVDLKAPESDESEDEADG